MNDRLIAAALTLAHLVLIGGLAATGLATPANAQCNHSMDADFHSGAALRAGTMI